MKHVRNYQEITASGYVPGEFSGLVLLAHTVGKNRITYYHYTTRDFISHATWPENQAVLDIWNQNTELTDVFGQGCFPVCGDRSPRSFEKLLNKADKILAIENWMNVDEAFASIAAHFLYGDFGGKELDPLSDSEKITGGLTIAKAHPIFSTLRPIA